MKTFILVLSLAPDDKTIKILNIGKKWRQISDKSRLVINFAATKKDKYQSNGESQLRSGIEHWK